MPLLKVRHLFISHVWEYDQQYRKVVSWFSNANNFSWKNYSVPIDKPIDTESVSSKKAMTQEIEIGITNKLNLSHGLIVLSGMCVNHSDWILYELEEAKRLNKPIIGVRPWGNQRLPRIVKNLATEIVSWQSASVIKAVRDNIRL